MIGKYTSRREGMMMAKSIIKKFEQDAGIKLHPESKWERGEKREDLMLIGERFYVIEEINDNITDQIIN
jgi:hypothetical protein